MTKKRIHFLYSIVLTAMLLITGICLCVACAAIYFSGKQPFTPESVAAAFRYIAVPVYLCIALAIGGLILDAISPAETTKRKIRKAMDPPTSSQSGHKLLYARLALLGVGIAIFAYGFIAGGTADVMTKAVNICTECVGLG